MRLGVFAKTFPGSDPLTVMRAARDAGYDTVQYNMACSGLPSMPDAITGEQAAAVAAASRKTGVSVAAVSGTYNMIHPDPAVRETGLRRLSVLIGAAAAMGTAMVTLCTGSRDAHDQWRHHPDNATPEAWADLLAEMAKAVTLAEAKGVALGVEPELANVVSNARAARRLLDELQSPALRIVLDPANLFETERDHSRIIAEAVDVLAGDIGMAHAKDRDAAGGFVAAGHGVVDFPDFVRRLHAAGFNGDLVTHGLESDEAPGVAAFLRPLLAR